MRRYKRKGVQITCETCPQYFSLTEDEILAQGALARVNPPLRTKADVEAIIEGLKDGTIDAIATDHAPHSAEEKTRPLTDAPSGMVGLETALAVALTYLYHTGEMALSDILRRMTINPACILRLPLCFLGLTALLSTLGGSLLAALGRKGRAPNWNLDKYREARQSGWTCDASLLREELGYAPALTLDQGMQEAVEGYRREGLL